MQERLKVTLTRGVKVLWHLGVDAVVEMGRQFASRGGGAVGWDSAAKNEGSISILTVPMKIFTRIQKAT